MKSVIVFLLLLPSVLLASENGFSNLGFGFSSSAANVRQNDNGYLFRDDEYAAYAGPAISYQYQSGDFVFVSMFTNVSPQSYMGFPMHDTLDNNYTISGNVSGVVLELGAGYKLLSREGLFLGGGLKFSHSSLKGDNTISSDSGGVISRDDINIADNNLSPWVLGGIDIARGHYFYLSYCLIDDLLEMGDRSKNLVEVTYMQTFSDNISFLASYATETRTDPESNYGEITHLRLVVGYTF